MSAMDHQMGYPGSDTCNYCLEPWPCPVAKIRKELAEVVLSMLDELGGSYQYNCGHDEGREAAAKLIEGTGA